MLFRSYTAIPTSIQSQVQTQRHGLLVESISATAVTNRYAYDALNRRMAVTDGRGNTSPTATSEFTTEKPLPPLTEQKTGRPPQTAAQKPPSALHREPPGFAGP